ncbi:MAG: ABC transporter ATP-binding protein, partial [Clostridia bacterium]|nr:ABC transporter ATP-binding protein [Clostridia bacterium]
PALRGIDLDIREGEFLLLIGPSGCGKSTLLRHLKTCLTPHGKRSGSVTFSGRPLDELDERAQAARIGFVFQHPDDQIVTDKVWHELAFGLESLGTEPERMRVRVAEMASYFGLESLFYRDVDELSGGQKQLLNLASVMAMSPEALILDEPTSQLDPIAAFDFLSTVKKLNTELGITVVLSEHRLEEAMQFADRVAVMENGRIVAAGAPGEAARELFEKGSSMYLAMPAAAKISLGLGFEETALTVNEGRRLVNSLGLEKRLIHTEKPVTERGAAALEADDVWFRYEKDEPDVLKGVRMKLFTGEICGLVGGNGTGKSTLLSVLAGVNVPYRGKLRVNGKKMKNRFSAFEERIGILDQDPRTIFSEETVEADLIKAASNRTKERVDERVAAAVKLMDIGDCLGRNPFDLSGGEQQRSAIAIILLTEPKILMLDEPTKGMDAGVKKALGEKLKELRKEGLAILIVSHDTEFCAEYADRVGLMFDGGIVTENNTRDFFCENIFYTTAANRIAREVCPNALLTEEVLSIAERKE